jgi:nucleotide-binding universal stress UspA family protein
MNFKKILIAVDDSAHSMKAAKAGFALAHDIKAVIGILFVIDKSREVVSADLGITPEQGKAALLEEAEKIIAQYIKMYDGEGEIFRFMPEGLPAEEILKIAKEWEADLIVMGAHGRSGLDRLLTGSVTRQVTRHAEIPIMITPREKN